MISKILLHVADLKKELAETIREMVLSCTFDNYVNAKDGVSYPGIAPAPEKLAHLFHMIIEREIAARIKPNVTFARMMSAGMKVPHRVHDDHVMGQYSAHIYLSKEWPEGSGTAFYRDLYGSETSESWRPEYGTPHYSDLRSWKKLSLVQAEFGRILIHRAELWHSAEPTAGFGKEPQDSRLVLTCFFDLV